jgi:hypothetical protein
MSMKNSKTNVCFYLFVNFLDHTHSFEGIQIEKQRENITIARDTCKKFSEAGELLSIKSQCCRESLEGLIEMLSL